MDIRKVKKLIELLDESGIAEIEITEGEESVRISRVSRATPPAQHAPAYPPPPPAPVASAAPASQGAAAATPASEPEEDGYAVTAPMVGTFYSSSSPGSPPFVQVGDRVKQGDVLCIVEAMKMMNQIEAEVSGTIKAAKVQNGEPVEYGQVLFLIDQRGST